MFFGSFQVLHLMEKQAYNLELSSRWKIHDVLNTSLLEQNITSKEQVKELLKCVPELHTREDKNYKVKAIRDSFVYANKAVKSQLLGLYYIISWKS